MSVLGFGVNIFIAAFFENRINAVYIIAISISSKE